MTRCDRKGSGGTYYFEKIEFSECEGNVTNIEVSEWFGYIQLPRLIVLLMKK